MMQSLAHDDADLVEPKSVIPLPKFKNTHYYHNQRVLNALQNGHYDILDVLENSRRELLESVNTNDNGCALTNKMLTEIWTLLRGEKYGKMFSEQVRDRSQRIRMILSLHEKRWNKRQQATMSSMEATEQKHPVLLTRDEVEEQKLSEEETAPIENNVSRRSVPRVSPATTIEGASSLPQEENDDWKLTNWPPTLRIIEEKLEANEIDAFVLVGNSVHAMEAELLQNQGNSASLSAVKKELWDLIFCKMRGDKYRKQFSEEYPSKAAKMKAILHFYRHKMVKRERDNMISERTTNQSGVVQSLSVQENIVPQLQNEQCGGQGPNLGVIQGQMMEPGQSKGRHRHHHGVEIKSGQESMAEDVVKVTNDTKGCKKIITKLRRNQVDVYELIGNSLHILERNPDEIPSVTVPLISLLFVKMRGQKYEQQFLEQFPSKKEKLQAVLKLYNKKMEKRRLKDHAVAQGLRSARGNVSIHDRSERNDMDATTTTTTTTTASQAESLIKALSSPKNGSVSPGITTGPGANFAVLTANHNAVDLRLTNDTKKCKTLFEKLKANEVDVYELIGNSIDVLQRNPGEITAVTMDFLTLMFVKMRGKKYERQFLQAFPSRKEKLGAVIKLYNKKVEKRQAAIEKQEFAGNDEPMAEETNVLIRPGYQQNAEAQTVAAWEGSNAMSAGGEDTGFKSTGEFSGSQRDQSIHRCEGNSKPEKLGRKESGVVKLPHSATDRHKLTKKIEKDEVDVYELVGNSLGILQKDPHNIPHVSNDLLVLIFAKMRGEKYKERFLQEFPSKQEKIDAVLKFYRKKMAKRLAQATIERYQHAVGEGSPSKRARYA